MNTSSGREIKGLLRGPLGEKVVSCRRLSLGYNSMVFRASTERAEYFVKKYITHPADTRDRLGTEFAALAFLWENGIRNIPRPVCRDAAHNIGVYGFVPGSRLKPGAVAVRETKMAADFLRAVHSLVKTRGAGNQPIASEACLSIRAYIESIERRLMRLRDSAHGASRGGDGISQRLGRFLDEEFQPLFAEVKSRVIEDARKRGITVGKEIARGEMTLSPSDFGFHNAIRQRDGTLVFIDFEYYGWDDPAKLISDFYLQPAVPLPPALRKEFFEDVLGFFDNEDALIKRLPLAYRLSALKWCLLVLNPFLHTDSPKSYNKSMQLKKAREKLASAKEEFEAGAFPLLI
jgi:hypothetical protein